MNLTLAEMALNLVTAEARMLVSLEHGLEKVAAKIDQAAKDKIGEYQAANGMHDAWPELADSTKADRLRQGYTENDPLLRSGELRDSISHETKGLEAAIGSTSDIAVYQELGTDKIPPRPFLGSAAYEHMDDVKKIIGGAVITGIGGGKALDYKV